MKRESISEVESATLQLKNLADSNPQVLRPRRRQVKQTQKESCFEVTATVQTDHHQDQDDPMNGALLYQRHNLLPRLRS